jgi:hypothetical protein
VERAAKRASRKGASLKTIAETTAEPLVDAVLVETPLAMPAVVPAEGEGKPASDEWKTSSELEQD